MSRRCLTVLSSPLLLAASAPDVGKVLDGVNEAGRVSATLNDWRAIAFFLMFTNVVGIVERLIAGWQSRSTAAKLAQAIDRLAEATESRATDIKVTLALIQATERDLKDGQGDILDGLAAIRTELQSQQTRMNPR